MTNEDHVPHMSADDFRRHGHALIDWIASYLEGDVASYPVLAQVKPGEVRVQLPPTPPELPESFDAMMNDVERIIMPGVTHWQSPNFFAFFPANTSYPSILGELLSAGLGLQGMLWATSPACTELETHVLDWMAHALDLPHTFRSDFTNHESNGGGVIQDTASSASLCALLAARQRATGGMSNQHGVNQQLVAYTSNQAHSSIEKAVRIVGIGDAQLRRVNVDSTYAMDVEHLRALIESDRAAGRVPFFVSATIGTTSSLAIDPLRAIGACLETFNEDDRHPPVWLHVDGAMAGVATVCEEHRSIQDGLEHADSYCVNPHKWLLTNFDCDCFYVADRAALVRALSVLPEYLRNTATDSGKVIDYRDWHVPLGRRFRALKLWFVMRNYGLSGLRAHIRRGVSLARWFRAQVEAHHAFELLAPSELNLVCFRHTRGDTFNETLMRTLNDEGEMYLTHTRLDGQFVLRMAIGGTHTERHHVERAWRRIVATSESLH